MSINVCFGFNLNLIFDSFMSKYMNEKWIQDLCSHFNVSLGENIWELSNKKLTNNPKLDLSVDQVENLYNQLSGQYPGYALFFLKLHYMNYEKNDENYEAHIQQILPFLRSENIDFILLSSDIISYQLENYYDNSLCIYPLAQKLENEETMSILLNLLSNVPIFHLISSLLLATNVPHFRDEFQTALSPQSQSEVYQYYIQQGCYIFIDYLFSHNFLQILNSYFTNFLSLSKRVQHYIFKTVFILGEYINHKQFTIPIYQTLLEQFFKIIAEQKDFGLLADYFYSLSSFLENDSELSTTFFNDPRIILFFESSKVHSLNNSLILTGLSHSLHSIPKLSNTSYVPILTYIASFFESDLILPSLLTFSRIRLQYMILCRFSIETTIQFDPPKTIFQKLIDILKQNEISYKIKEYAMMAYLTIVGDAGNEEAIYIVNNGFFEIMDEFLDPMFNKMPESFVNSINSLLLTGDRIGCGKEWDDRAGEIPEIINHLQEVSNEDLSLDCWETTAFSLLQHFGNYEHLY